MKIRWAKYSTLFSSFFYAYFSNKLCSVLVPSKTSLTKSSIVLNKSYCVLKKHQHRLFLYSSASRKPVLDLLVKKKRIVSEWIKGERRRRKVERSIENWNERANFIPWENYRRRACTIYSVPHILNDLLFLYVVP